MNRKFFERESTVVAQDLIGKIFIVRDLARNKKWVTRIVETEAYRTDDESSHCARGWTERCAPMFEQPARSYVYFIYGMYTMLNFVVEPEGVPAAILIRALEPISGFGGLVHAGNDAKVLNGPGKLTRELGITLKDNRVSLLRGRFEVKDDGFVPEKILVSPRVGIREKGLKKPWRFMWAGHPAVSKAPENKQILKVITFKNQSARGSE